jgi:alpha-glucosidase
MKRFLYLLFILGMTFFSSCLYAQSTPVEILGDVQTVAKQGDILVIKTKEAEARVWVYSPAVIRVNISKQFNLTDSSYAVIQAPTGLNYTESNTALEIVTARVKLVINKSPLRFSFFTLDGKPLSSDDIAFGTNWQNSRVTNYRKLYAGERFIGLGEKKGNLDRRGRKITNWNADVGGDDPQYKTYPFFMGLHDSLTYGIFLDNTNKTFFDFGASTDDQMSWIGAEAGDLNYYFFGAQTVAKIIEDYTWLTGRMEMPPLWSLGYQQCRWSYGSTKEMLEVARTFRRLQIPADVLYCDIDYMDGYKIFTWNNSNFPDPKAMIDTLKAMNFHLVNIVDPGIKVEKGYNKYDEGIEKNYFATYPNGEAYVGAAWPGRVHFPNFLNNEVRQWWGSSFTALTTPGVEGFWNDMNEPSSWGQSIPSMVKMGKYYLPEVNNVYGMQMVRGTYEGARQLLGNKRPFVLTRSAYAGTQRYSAVWTGDNTSNDEHLMMGQALVNSLGLSGMAFTGVDIGGFFGNGSPNLMVRWNSLGVYTPMFRNHACAGTAYREPWRWGEENEKIIKKDIEERYRLMPYIYSSFYQAHRTGLPVSRSLAINYAQDKNIYLEAYQHEFLFGDNMLVAPVTSSATMTDVYLPKGNWYKKNSDSLYEGGSSYKVAAPLNDLPVFIKAGAIITKQAVVQSTSDIGDGILELHIWNGKESSSFSYYEDDGTSYNYQQGKFYNRVIHFEPVKRKITFDAVSGDFVSKYKRIKLVLHGFENIQGIRVSGRTGTGKNNSLNMIFENKATALNITY